MAWSEATGPLPNPYNRHIFTVTCVLLIAAFPTLIARRVGKRGSFVQKHRYSRRNRPIVDFVDLLTYHWYSYYDHLPHFRASGPSDQTHVSGNYTTLSLAIH